MSATDLLNDGSTVLRTLARPASGLTALTERPRAAVALGVATALALAAAAVTVPRTDYGPGQAAVENAAEGQPVAEPTQYEREQSAMTARKLGALLDWSRAAFLPSLLAALAAGGLTLGFRTCGARASFQHALAVTAHGMLPIWLARLLSIPSALVQAPISAADVPRLLPSSAAALLPPGASPALAGALGALDLFALWAVWLVALGMARAAGTSRTRALVTTLVLYLAYVAVFRVAIPSALAAPGGGPGPVR
jgi:hypothetical protein